MSEQIQQNNPSNSGLFEGLSVASDRSTPYVAAIETLTALAARKRTILSVTIAAMLIGVLYSLLLTVLYTATTRIMTPQQPQSTAAILMSQLASSSMGSLVAGGPTSLGLRNPNDIYVGLLNSRIIADAIIHEFKLEDEYGTKNMTATRKKLEANTKIVPERSGLISITVTDRDKQRAADIANAYPVELRTLSKSLALTEASERRLFYEEQVKHAKDDLIAAEYSFQSLQRQKGFVQLDAQAKAMIAGLAELHGDISAKRVELQALRSYSTDNNPSVQLAEKQLASLVEEASKAEKRGSSSRPTDLGLQDVAGVGLEYLQAEHELQYRQVLFDSLLKQYDAARLDEAKYATVVQVAEPAVPPDLKSSPQRLFIVIMFTLTGFLGATFCLRILEHAQTNRRILALLAQFWATLIRR